MNRIAILILATMLSMIAQQVIAQQCGTVLQETPPFDRAAFEAFRQTDYRNEKTYVGVTVWVVEATTGTTTLSIETIENEIARANFVFARSGVEFFLCGSQRIIQGLTSYNYDTGDALHRSRGVRNTINIYYADDVQNNSSESLCGYAQFPWAGEPHERYIMMAKNCADNGATLSHELGHFYGLLHTHERGTGLELADGSNCNSAGDYHCDTPADPTLGFNNVNAGCLYNGNERDLAGARYNPLTNNIMSYAPSECRKFFTSEQSERVAFYSRTENDYLVNECDFYPDYGVSFDESQLMLRSGQRVQLEVTFEKINVTEEKTVDVYFYMSDDEEDRGIPFHKEMVTVTPGEGTSTLLFDIEVPLTRGTGQYELTMIFDATSLVLERTKKNNVTALQVVIDNTALGEATIFPNPTADFINVFFKNKTERRQVVVQFFNPIGQLLDTQEAYKGEEEFLRRFEIAHLPDGPMMMSLLFIDSGKRYTYKFVKGFR